MRRNDQSKVFTKKKAQTISKIIWLGLRKISDFKLKS